jgi:hypothetical protein
MASISEPIPKLFEPAEVRLQLERLLASPHIRHSKRCQALLTYVIEAYLDGSLDKIKERTLGIEVFHRDPGYDTNEDSVVRTTALEIRKRLAQYYAEPGHEHEIRVGLPAGSYIPEFRAPALVLPAPLPLAPEVFTPAPADPRRWKLRWAWAGAAALLLVAAAWTATLRLQPTELDLFWKPMIDDRASAIICIEQPLRVYRFEGPRFDELNQKMVGTASMPPLTDEQRKATSIPLSELKSAGDRYFTTGDFQASVRIAELLGRRGKPFDVIGDRSTNYRDLRGRPAVLMGAFSNRWTQGLTGNLRYQLVKSLEQRVYEVRDTQRGGKIVAVTSAEENRADEYVIVSRIFDTSTEKMVIAVSGMTFRGTGAGGDFLTNPQYMREAFKDAPRDWYRKNLQVVLKTAMVSGTAGPPSVIAAHFW